MSPWRFFPICIGHQLDLEANDVPPTAPLIPPISNIPFIWLVGAHDYTAGVRIAVMG